MLQHYLKAIYTEDSIDFSEISQKISVITSLIGFIGDFLEHNDTDKAKEAVTKALLELDDLKIYINKNKGL